MNKVHDYYQALLNKFNCPFPCIYKIAKYTLGHNSLVLMCESTEVNFADRVRRFITFEGVEYLQGYPSWQDASLKLASINKRDSYLTQIGFHADKFKDPLLVFYATLNDAEILIVCTRIYFSSTMPQLPEYTFD